MTSKPPSFGSVGGSVKFRSGALFAGNIAVTVIYGIGALLGFTMAGSYADLMSWASWRLVCAALAIAALVKKYCEK